VISKFKKVTLVCSALCLASVAQAQVEFSVSQEIEFHGNKPVYVQGTNVIHDDSQIDHSKPVCEIKPAKGVKSLAKGTQLKFTSIETTQLVEGGSELSAVRTNFGSNAKVSGFACDVPASKGDSEDRIADGIKVALKGTMNIDSMNKSGAKVAEGGKKVVKPASHKN
jgi:hypothetical protein